MEEKELTYEQAMERLEQALYRLDAGDLPLEESLNCFQEGLNYIKICQEKLNGA